LAVDYQYAANGTVSSRVWLTNWELGNDPVAPPPMLTGVKADAGAFVPDICVECYMTWKAKLTGMLYGSEVSDVLPNWGETSELMVRDQSQVPSPALVPDLSSSSKRATLYGALFKASDGDGGIVKCGGREAHEGDCYAKYEMDRDMCRLLAGPRGKRNWRLCLANAFDRYQQCRGY
jgi:hypothetical protein